MVNWGSTKENNTMGLKMGEKGMDGPTEPKREQVSTQSLEVQRTKDRGVLSVLGCAPVSSPHDHRMNLAPPHFAHRHHSGGNHLHPLWRV